MLYILLFSSVVTLLLTLIHLRLDYNHDIGVIEQQLRQIQLTNLATITQSIWTMDTESVQLQLEGLNRLPDIIRVELNDGNQLLAAAGEVNTRHIIEQRFPIQHMYKDREVSLGELKVVATKENVYNRLWDTVLIILVSQGVKTFLVSLFVLVIFYSLVTRHLSRIAEYSGQIDFRIKHPPLALDRRVSKLSQDDELDKLVDAINQMSQENNQAYNDLIQNQQMLAESEARFSAIFNSISDSIVVADMERRIIFGNPAMYKQFGYTLDEIKGQTTEILYADPAEYVQQGKQRYHAQAGKEVTAYEIQYRRKDGSVFDSETMGGQIRLEDGSLIGFIGVIRDISRRKQAEQENLSLQKQLQHAQKMEAVGMLTGGIAHDFNNILASILGYAELSQATAAAQADQGLGQYLQQIERSGLRARDLVAQMLAFSRGAPSEPKIIALSEVIEDTVNMLAAMLPSSIELLLQVEDQVPPVQVDEVQMHQLLLNLCVNARDAMEGSGTLTIGLKYRMVEAAVCVSCHQVINGDFVELYVGDSGTGIEAGLVERIFEPFLTTKEVGKGSGMGLAVVHGIIHQHQGHVLVDTQKGQGSVFRLLIPAVTVTEGRSGVRPDDADLVSVSGAGKHILVVDDEEAVVSYQQDLLESYGFKVSTYTRSQQAFTAFEKAPGQFDLVITDQTMPEMTGLELAKRIRSVRSDIPLVITSGYSEDINPKSIEAAGVTTCLNKPVLKQDLLKLLSELL